MVRLAAPPPERQPARWRARACHATAGCTLEAAADTSHHGLASKERGYSPAQYLSRRHGLTTSSAAWRARAASSSAVPALPRDSELSGAPARATRQPTVRRWRRAAGFLVYLRRSQCHLDRSQLKGHSPRSRRLWIAMAHFHRFSSRRSVLIQKSIIAELSTATQTLDRCALSTPKVSPLSTRSIWLFAVEE